jgi:magnesium transporter
MVMVRGLEWIANRRPGAAPGTLVFIGEQQMDEVEVSLIDYTELELKEGRVDRVEDTFDHLDSQDVTWVNIGGLHDVEAIRTLGDHLDLHPLLLEDVVNTTQRPKFEEYDEHLFLTMKMITFDQEEHHTTIEHVSIVLGRDYVLSFQEKVGDVFEPVRERIRRGKGRIRKRGADYLAYALLDTIVDNYFLTLEALGEEVAQLEEELMADPSPDVMRRIHTLKRETILIRRSISPLREVVSAFNRGESELVEERNGIYIRDLYDHTIQVADIVDTYRDVISSLMDLHISLVSNRMNEVMKVLTIIATIFIPLTFIAGIYGMNFENMPELGWHYAYLAVWVVIIIVGVSMVLYFRRLKWL